MKNNKKAALKSGYEHILEHAEEEIDCLENTADGDKEAEENSYAFFTDQMEIHKKNGDVSQAQLDGIMPILDNLNISAIEAFRQVAKYCNDRIH